MSHLTLLSLHACLIRVLQLCTPPCTWPHTQISLMFVAFIIVDYAAVDTLFFTAMQILWWDVSWWDDCQTDFHRKGIQLPDTYPLHLKLQLYKVTATQRSICTVSNKIKCDWICEKGSYSISSFMYLIGLRQICQHNKKHNRTEYYAGIILA